MIGGDVSNRIAVRDHVTREAPPAAQLVLQQVLVGACRLSIYGVVRTHHRSSLAFHDGRTKCGFVGVQLVVQADIDVGKMPRRLRPAMDRKVLRRGNGEVVFRIIALQSGHVGDAHAAGQEGVFPVGLLASAPARIAEDIQVG